MKTLFIAINSSYVHTNPAIRALAGVSGSEWREYNINQPMHAVLQDIYEQKPQIAAFSCYIWNIGYVLRVAQDLKKISPQIKILLGGPEVSFDAHEQMEKHSFIDAIVCGEAEQAVGNVLDALLGGAACGVCGVFLRKSGRVEGEAGYLFLDDIGVLVQPEERFSEHRIYYYESSRGCPFHCAYCLSGTGVPLREKPLAQVKEELGRFVSGGARLVKFTDRTFNANKTRARELWDYIIGNTGETKFHFEVALDLLDGDALAVLRRAPEGKIQLEAGVQSCNEKTLQTVVRKTDLRRLKHNAREIVKTGNIHLHLDLIAGLPYEDMHSFGRSFNEIYSLGPHHLQLGFLKLLKGSRLRGEAGKYGICYRDYPPYEVLQTADMDASELFFLKGVDELLNRYYNTGRAKNALSYLMQEEGIRPFGYFCSLQEYCVQHGYAERPVSAADQFRILIGHAQDCLPQADREKFLRELKTDYIRTRIKGRMPKELEQAE